MTSTGPPGPARRTARPRTGRRIPGTQLGNRLWPYLRNPEADRVATTVPNGSVSQLARSRHHVLVTYRRDGAAVPTPLWAAYAEGCFYVRTERTSGKVKRLRRNPRALLAPATARGRPLGAPVDMRGRTLGPEEEPMAEHALAAAYGWSRKIFEASVDVMKVDMCYLELVPVQP